MCASRHEYYTGCLETESFTVIQRPWKMSEKQKYYTSNIRKFQNYWKYVSP